ncbi:MAG: DUF3311 domain-containing protein [Candidatus Acididesulfobacter diazotrophicus]|uniref:DUF3311 domain-containing protein n=1 Tax=Candidatus Acididesulfobacter diazotrophicus TaxID=2597226 RepID=A0A519BJN4_9DELT|nr:MAG: DUF3311 domain-containing protein [Candidatus Acididesulfobacter diazotrophicus]
MKFRYFLAVIFVAIPLLAYLLIPIYDRKTPILLGLPFFYFYQIIWLIFSAIFFYIAAILIDLKD